MNSLPYIILLIAVVAIASVIYFFKDGIRSGLIKLRTKLHVQGLRQAIIDADTDKEKTGRKNMVVFDSSTQAFMPVQKSVLKSIANAGKNKNNAAMTKGRRRAQSLQQKKKRALGHERVKEVENKSLYVTK